MTPFIKFAPMWHRKNDKVFLSQNKVHVCCHFCLVLMKKQQRFFIASLSNQQGFVEQKQGVSVLSFFDHA
jgi:hypothetical protein